MTVGERLKQLRRELGLSQEAIGAQGFVSTTTWINVENGQRALGDSLVVRFVDWLTKERYVDAGRAAALTDALLTLKYLGHRSAFVQKLAYHYAKSLFADTSVYLSEDPKTYRVKPRRRA